MKNLFLCCIFTPIFVMAIEPYDRHYISFITQNDAYFDSLIDRYYTAGHGITYASNEVLTSSDDGIAKIFFGLISGTSSYSLSLSQLLYTPKDKSATKNLPYDHPYAEYLSIGFALHNRSDDFLENIAIRLGFTGRYSLGKHAQDMIHNLLNLQLAKGWDNELKGEFVANLYYDLTYMVSIIDTKYFSIDVLPNLDLALGNANIYAKISATFRAGYNLSSTFLTQGVNGENGGANSGRVFKDGLGIYVFGGLSGAYVARNMFIDGNLIAKNDIKIKRKKSISSIEAGFAIVSGDLSFIYKIIYTSKEFDTQDKAHGVGSFNISYSF